MTWAARTLPLPCSQEGNCPLEGTYGVLYAIVFHIIFGSLEIALASDTALSLCNTISPPWLRRGAEGGVVRRGGIAVQGFLPS